MKEKDECSPKEFALSAAKGCIAGGTAGFFSSGGNPIAAGTGCAIGALGNAGVRVIECAEQQEFKIEDAVCTLF